MIRIVDIAAPKLTPSAKPKGAKPKAKASAKVAKTDSNAARQRAYRDRKKAALSHNS